MFNNLIKRRVMQFVVDEDDTVNLPIEYELLGFGWDKRGFPVVFAMVEDGWNDINTHVLYFFKPGQKVLPYLSLRYLGELRKEDNQVIGPKVLFVFEEI